MSLADDVRSRSQIAVLLPDAQVTFTFRVYTVRKMLEGGIAPLIRQYAEDAADAEEQAEQIVEEARAVLVACSVEPELTIGEPVGDSQLCVHDLSDADVMTAFDEIIRMDDSLYYGTNRTVDPDELDGLIEAQMKISHTIVSVSKFFGLSPLDVERWYDDELGRVLAMIDAWKYIEDKNE